MPDPTHLAATITDRGFKHMPPLGDVSVAESSAASGPHLWLRIADRQLGPVQAVAHLTAEQAWQLKEQIEWLLEHHYQGDARVVAGPAGQPEHQDVITGKVRHVRYSKTKDETVIEVHVPSYCKQAFNDPALWDRRVVVYATGPHTP